MKSPGIWASLVLPAAAIGSAGAVVLFVSGHPVLASLLVPGALVAWLVVRFMWGRG
jgi:hypothetical protein